MVSCIRRNTHIHTYYTHTQYTIHNSIVTKTIEGKIHGIANRHVNRPTTLFLSIINREKTHYRI